MRMRVVRLAMRRKTIVLLVAIISLCVVLLQFVVKRNNLLQFEILGKNTQDTKEWDSANKPRLEPLTGSEESGHLSDLFQNKQKEWMKSVVLTRSTAPLPKVDAVNCTKIWQNDEQELRAAHDYQQSNGTQPTKNVRHYLQETANCTSYLLNGGFLSASVDENELSFPLAFSLMVHSNVEQVERLLRAVYRPHNVYCIHPDNKSSDDFHSSLRFIAGCLPNVNIIERPLSVEWGKYSVLQADVECMRLLWKHPRKWRYFINLTGQEFPLKTNKEIVRILQTFNGANDITGTHDKLFHFRWQKFLPAPYNLTISMGSVHITASRGYVDYVINSRVARDFYQWVAPTFIPDEIFFSTMNYNPQLGVSGSHTGEVDDKTRKHFHRYKIWLHGGNYTGVCDGKAVRSICHFGVGDVPRMVASPYLFANKFSYDYMPLAYDCVEEWYWHKVHLENMGQAPALNLTPYEMSTMVTKRYDGPVKIWE
ncbi:beta-1,3-galactosyl-O-glycosyl-glycoprotein beta-1,6-N-acetylglucosaminyltransferase-like isoform X2 [Pomacea canaliculata]|uniref:beta-1,3-galactosyl-O-glycosyl-glycoprotein beta-1,6-N-acetylglucosaminyltransferase-like isoform X2 n=1 Tax=Pomacea canaliculata TaxID=400727 RepID=UPI000D73531D|nr:beta-1,3-galactosyl-O-glycosyl-glycoprotein beta-1,6-N-acetylglucosaminyltransferase-like isoform X2 [Pomacea canaliculata]